MKKPLSSSPDLENFFDEMIGEMFQFSPAVKNLHPLLRDALLRTIKKGDLEKRKNILKSLMTESHQYMEITASLQKKYGFNPEDYIKKLELWVTKDVAESTERAEVAQAESAFNNL